MPGFSITPVAAFPPVSSDGFPRFLQFQHEGVNVGDTAVETLNFTGGGIDSVTLNSAGSEVTVDVPAAGGGGSSLQFQDDGVDVGDTTVATVNFTGSAVASVTLAPDAQTLRVQLNAAPLSWREVPGDGVLEADDADNGIAATGVSGEQVLTIPDDSVAFDVGTSILIVAEGGAGVHIVAASGVELRHRAVLSAILAGQYAVATLIKRAANFWYLCGDLEEV